MNFSRKSCLFPFTIADLGLCVCDDYRHFLMHGKMHVHIMERVEFGYQMGDSC